MQRTTRSFAFRSTAIALVLAAAMAAAGVRASSDSDCSRDAVQHGQVLEVELERDDGRWF